ncbi:katanin p60 ATPase-containing subunit A-like 2 [Selaginella moellendorffii]|uniref:katanin p60 ATPase-containing subunit A-like 2 n=1 Tax=Selaginella moellendorffii TaxID=88036 RepID=UPI000D1CC7E5|nr:katanin p60 ATPase-containing subunit A-like 2 [Selaginella moellendorffii]|eukprot:XP_002989553.2 katanin p60 ATPase-containing subunit A-like 2 [Selaginella moellendorffii]
MEDASLPALTRWSFQDFKEAYKSRFRGSSNQQQQQEHDKPPQLEEDSAMDQRATAIYEQFLPSKPKATTDDETKSSPDLPHRWTAKPMPHLLFGEMQELADSIVKDIVRGNVDVRWDSIKGLENAKRLLKEAVVMPIKYPQYFTGLLSPWKGILLFGPPGTGKTLLAKAVATECNTTFFNISASTIVSKYRGDSEKLVRMLFDLARHYAPSTIFLDEIDAIISQRGEANSEHEASRRLKTELLIQMDGLMQANDLVFVLAATNIPWELDAAMLRRLEKRILVPLPDAEARRAMLEELLPTSMGDVPYDDMVESTDGYSGSDVRLVCKEAAMRPLRRLMEELERNEAAGVESQDLEMGPVTKEDAMVALTTTRPSALVHAGRYEKFDNDFGSR